MLLQLAVFVRIAFLAQPTDDNTQSPSLSSVLPAAFVLVAQQLFNSARSMQYQTSQGKRCLQLAYGELVNSKRAQRVYKLELVRRHISVHACTPYGLAKGRRAFSANLPSVETPPQTPPCKRAAHRARAYWRSSLGAFGAKSHSMLRQRRPSENYWHLDGLARLSRAPWGGFQQRVGEFSPGAAHLTAVMAIALEG